MGVGLSKKADITDSGEWEQGGGQIQNADLESKEIGAEIIIKLVEFFFNHTQPYNYEICNLKLPKF